MSRGAGLAAALVLLAACNRPERPTPAAGDSPIDLTDALGRSVVLAAPPMRIAITGKAGGTIAEAAYLFPEAASRVVALTGSSQGRGNLIALVDPASTSKTMLNHDPSAEQLAAVGADLVILKSNLSSAAGGPISALGIPVVHVDLETPEQYVRDLRILGKVFQNEARAAELVTFYQERVARIEVALRGVNERPRVLLLYHSNRDGRVAFKVPPSGWIQTRLVELAGGIPVWAGASPGQGWTQVTLEQVAAWDADCIFVVSYVTDPTGVVAELTQDPHWRALRAVRERRLLPFPGDLTSWDQPGTRWVLGLTWLAGRLHPERFPNLDIVREAQQLYERLYGLDRTLFERQIRSTFTGDVS